MGPLCGGQFLRHVPGKRAHPSLQEQGWETGVHASDIGYPCMSHSALIQNSLLIANSIRARSDFKQNPFGIHPELPKKSFQNLFRIHSLPIKTHTEVIQKSCIFHSELNQSSLRTHSELIANSSRAGSVSIQKACGGHEEIIWNSGRTKSEPIQNLYRTC